MILKRTYARPDIHETWDAVYHRNPLQDNFNDTMLERITADLNFAPNALLLDACCGMGYHSLRIARRGYRCAGVDISEHIVHKAVANASQSGPASTVSFICQERNTCHFGMRCSTPSTAEES